MLFSPFHITSFAHSTANGFRTAFAWFKMLSTQFYEFATDRSAFNIMALSAKPFDFKWFGIVSMMGVWSAKSFASGTSAGTFNLSRFNCATRYTSRKLFSCHVWISALFGTSKSALRSFSLVSRRTVDEFTAMAAFKIIT